MVYVYIQFGAKLFFIPCQLSIIIEQITPKLNGLDYINIEKSKIKKTDYTECGWGIGAIEPLRHC